MLHMFILTVLSKWSLFNLGLYIFPIIFPVFLSGTLKVSVESFELKKRGYFPVTLIFRNIQMPIFFECNIAFRANKLGFSTIRISELGREQVSLLWWLF